MIRTICVTQLLYAINNLQSEVNIKAGKWN
jgi:hypothetical protein